MNKPDATKWNPISAEVQKDQREAYDKMREHCPVAYSEDRGWSVFRQCEITQIINDPETFSNEISAHLSVPNGMDPPEHTKYRHIVEYYFTDD